MRSLRVLSSVLLTLQIALMALVQLSYELPPTPVICKPSKDCAHSVEVCAYDERNGCIRKFATKCHMEIAACRTGQNFTDFSSYFCSMETFFCEEGYERWTIFFGHEKN